LERKEGPLGRKAATAVKSLKGAGLITIVDLGLAGLAGSATALGLVGALGLVLLVESAALMLLGGALSFSGQAGVRKATALLTGIKTEVTKAELADLDAKAAAYALAGALLFVESLVLAAATA
jgi:hypothetical protein